MNDANKIKYKKEIINLLMGVFILTIFAFLFKSWVFMSLNFTIVSYICGKYFICFINKKFDINVYDILN